MTAEKQQQLESIAKKIRLLSLEGIYNAGSGHPGGSLSIADIIAYLYFDKMNINVNDPRDPERDRFVLSKGHGCPALYAALAMRGFFDESEIKNLRKSYSFLQGHPDMKRVPGVDMSTGSLGQGFSAACGMAKSAKIFKKNYKVYTVLGDGEIQEGQVWEAAMFAAHYNLDNLIGFVDYNHLQIDGRVEDVMNPAKIDEKFASFRWFTKVINGHSFPELEAAVAEAEKSGRPSMIICETVKGKGVSFMENVASWHGVAPKQEQYEQAVAELSRC